MMIDEFELWLSYKPQPELAFLGLLYQFPSTLPSHALPRHEQKVPVSVAQ